VLQETTIHDKEAAVRAARDRLNAEAHLRPDLEQDRLLVELMKRLANGPVQLEEILYFQRRA
jgi:hypothetical protein